MLFYKRHLCILTIKTYYYDNFKQINNKFKRRFLKKSYDNGLTWSKLQVIWNDGENTCGNPSPVVDNESGRISLLST